MDNKQDLITKLESSLKLLDKVVLLIGLKKKLLDVIIISNNLTVISDNLAKENDVKLDIDEDELKQMHESLDKLSAKSIALAKKYKKSIKNKSQKELIKSTQNLLDIFKEAKESFEGIDSLRAKQITIH